VKGDYTRPKTHTEYNWCHQINRLNVWELSTIYLEREKKIMKWAWRNGY